MAGNKIIIVHGGQYGSEAKGQIAGTICERENVDIAVRTGATNAGHTYYHMGVSVKFQQLPVAAAIPGIQLVIGAGALIDPAILDREVQLASELTGEDVRKRLAIDPRAGVHLPFHAERSSLSGRHVTMGATGKGCSEALVDRIKNRGQNGNTIANFDQWVKLNGEYRYDLRDTEYLLNRAFDRGEKILLEGTQGQGLDLYLGPYPYTTHKQTGPAQWMLECGLSPALPTDIVMVVRTYPIRVAGNSGPMSTEISWPILARDINDRRNFLELPSLVDEWAIKEFEQAVREITRTSGLGVPAGSDGLDQWMWRGDARYKYREALSQINTLAMHALTRETVEELGKLFEFTTVTKKLRRVGTLDLGHLEAMARQIRPHRIAVTFMNYVYSEHWYRVPDAGWDMDKVFRTRVETICHAPVEYVGWGPHSGPEHVARVRP